VNRAPIVALSLLTLLSGCPLPQPLASYPSGTVTPPRILMDSIGHPDTINQVPAACTGSFPSYDLSATLVDNDTTEAITARWFVDYDQHNSARCVPAVPETVIPAPPDGASDPTRRQVSAYRFVPYDHLPTVGPDSVADGAGAIHVVELVVSNRFDTSRDDVALCTADATGFPYRTPATQGSFHFETQVYRWVFVNVAASDSLPCP
jgi:hypothetical protein